MRIIKKCSIAFLYFKFTIQFWSSVETEARSLNNMHFNFHQPLRNGLMTMDVIGTVDGHDSILPTTFTKRDISHRHKSDVAPKSFQDYLSTVIEEELRHKGKGLPKHSRQRRSKIKFIIKKILLFVKLLAKYFFFVAKKTAIIVG